MTIQRKAMNVPTETIPTLRFLPVAEPVFAGNEKAYVNDCLDSSWISSIGKYIDQFEALFAEFCHTKHALSCINGTAALHLALLGLGIGPGDEVLVPSLTFVASANAVAYCGAKPVFVDIDPETWNIDSALIEEKVTPHTKAIMVVHLFGLPAEMNAIQEIARKQGLFIIEDAAEAHGAEYRGQPVGSIGDVATFSFYGNKIITTGEGGMITTNDDALARKMRQLKGQGQDLERRYWFPILGYNYRMTNIQAALGLAQLEKVDWHLERRREVALWYSEYLGSHPAFIFQAEPEDCTHVHWLNSIVLGKDFPMVRDETMHYLRSVGIETRPFFYPMHQLPMYQDLATADEFPVSDEIAARGLSLPSSSNLTRDDVQRVSEELIALASNRK